MACVQDLRRIAGEQPDARPLDDADGGQGLNKPGGGVAHLADIQCLAVQEVQQRAARILVKRVYQQAHRIERSANGILLRIHGKASSSS